MPEVGHRARFAHFDSSSTKGDICVLGDVACRTRSNPHASGMLGHFAAGACRFLGSCVCLLVTRDKLGPKSTTIESSGNGRTGCRTVGSICNGFVGQTRTRILIPLDFGAGQWAGNGRCLAFLRYQRPDMAIPLGWTISAVVVFFDGSRDTSTHVKPPAASNAPPMMSPVETLPNC